MPDLKEFLITIRGEDACVIEAITVTQARVFFIRDHPHLMDAMDIRPSEIKVKEREG
jgi:hypothetical protein